MWFPPYKVRRSPAPAADQRPLVCVHFDNKVGAVINQRLISPMVSLRPQSPRRQQRSFSSMESFIRSMIAGISCLSPACDEMSCVSSAFHGLRTCRSNMRRRQPRHKHYLRCRHQPFSSGMIVSEWFRSSMKLWTVPSMAEPIRIPFMMPVSSPAPVSGPFGICT